MNSSDRGGMVVVKKAGGENEYLCRGHCNWAEHSYIVRIRALSCIIGHLLEGASYWNMSVFTNKLTLLEGGC